MYLNRREVVQVHADAELVFLVNPLGEDYQEVIDHLDKAT